MEAKAGYADTQPLTMASGVALAHTQSSDDDDDERSRTVRRFSLTLLLTRR